LGKFIPKNTNFLPTLLSHNGEVWHEGADLGLPGSLLQAKFGKNRLRGICLFAKLYQRIAFLAILGAVSPHNKSDNGEI